MVTRIDTVLGSATGSQFCHTIFPVGHLVTGILQRVTPASKVAWRSHTPSVNPWLQEADKVSSALKSERTRITSHTHLLRLRSSRAGYSMSQKTFPKTCSFVSKNGNCRSMHLLFLAVVPFRFLPSIIPFRFVPSRYYVSG